MSHISFLNSWKWMWQPVEEKEMAKIIISMPVAQYYNLHVNVFEESYSP